MAGGASARRYLRIATPGGSVVAMFVPDADRPEEMMPGAVSPRWSFLEVQALLCERGVRVPAVLGEACDRGLVLLEDLGDRTMEAFVEAAPARRAEVYSQAVRDLARAQRALAELPASSIVATRALDATLLRWELDHFRAWGLDARGRRPSRGIGGICDDRAEFDAVAGRLAQRVAAWPQGFVHRDYQSRNLMVLDAPGGGIEIVWMDFQDALLGPRVHDLVALLNDSYQELDRAFVEVRLDEYAAAAELDRAGRERLGWEFDVVTVQRKLKDAGRYVFLDRVNGDSGFLRYVEPTLAKVRAALARLGDDEDMCAMKRLLTRA